MKKTDLQELYFDEHVRIGAIYPLINCVHNEDLTDDLSDVLVECDEPDLKNIFKKLGVEILDSDGEGDIAEKIMLKGITGYLVSVHIPVIESAGGEGAEQWATHCGFGYYRKRWLFADEVNDTTLENVIKLAQEDKQAQIAKLPK